MINPRGLGIQAEPLTILMDKDQPWTWNCEQQDAFDTLKQKLD
uniref:Reverse transcriptase/retrotransposon-derived protein RNase H-like domain-containing protein n=1 Tax=Physcomitrium patens TaxID=3218 RepID=A0A2K1JIB6_PHYPA|nr:hypothetical protein PHYPA_018696 [Physcomitrium patens]